MHASKDVGLSKQWWLQTTNYKANQTESHSAHGTGSG